MGITDKVTGRLKRAAGDLAGKDSGQAERPERDEKYMEEVREEQHREEARGEELQRQAEARKERARRHAEQVANREEDHGQRR